MIVASHLGHISGLHDVSAWLQEMCPLIIYI